MAGRDINIRTLPYSVVAGWRCTYTRTALTKQIECCRSGNKNQQETSGDVLANYSLASAICLTVFFQFRIFLKLLETLNFYKI